MTGAVEVCFTDDAAEALSSAGDFLRSRPVEHNLVLSLLTQRVAHPEEGRYWWATEAGDVAGFVFQSPRSFRAVVGPAGPGVVDALVEAVSEQAPALPGVMGDATTASAFAGRWAERLRVPATPFEGQRIYRLGALRPPEGVPGRLRVAQAGDRDVLADWIARFIEDIGGHPLTPRQLVDHHLSAGRLWVWDDGEPVSVAGASEVVAGVSRVALVYTPPERRGRGYAAACVAALSEGLLAGRGPGPDRADTCILYTQLHNPTSNAVYRRIGYEPVVEVLIYRFG